MRPWLSTLLVLTLVACDAPTPPKTPSETPRVVTLSPHLTEYMYWLGLEKHLVATVAYSDYPEPAARLPRVGDAFNINYEALLAAKPTLVLAWQGGTNQIVINRVRQLGIHVQVIPASQLSDITKQAQIINQSLGYPEQRVAKQLSEIKQVLAAATKEEAQATSATTKKVFVQFGASPGYTVGSGDMINGVLQHCGASNAFADVKRAAFKVSEEALASRKIDVVLLTSEDESVIAAATKHWSRLRQHHATPINIITTNPDWISRPGPRMIKAVQDICRKLR